MQIPTQIAAQDLKKAQALITQKKVFYPLYSEGTYQVEVLDQKKSYWPFLQLNDSAEVLDAFCSCPQAEKKQVCVHLAAAYLKIIGSEKIPLHVRFRESLWNVLAQTASGRLGYDADLLRTDPQEGYEGQAITGKKLFYIRALNPKGKKQLKALIKERSLETEETSLKFSKLSLEEITLWKEGRPSHTLRYELSFWSDLAKWWMQLQENDRYQIAFSSEDGGLPQWINITFPECQVGFYIAQADWAEVIPALKTVRSPLFVKEDGIESIESLEYKPEEQVLQLHFHKQITSEEQFQVSEEKLEVGDWFYLPRQGFIPQQRDPLFHRTKLSMHYLNDFLNRYDRFVKRNLKNVPLHLGPIPIRYQLYFDPQQALHIDGYVFELQDLQKKLSAYFGDWVYIDGKGFYLLEQQLFDQKAMAISKEKVGEFVGRHRNWLQGYECFQTHVSGLESQLSYRVNSDLSIEFFTRIEAIEEEGILDFGEWLYVKGKGFYAKKTLRPDSPLRSGLKIPMQYVSSFIRRHKEDLDNVAGFFSAKYPLEKIGLVIQLTSEQKISIEPQWVFAPTYSQDRVQLFGDYTFVENEGFCPIPEKDLLPENYRSAKVIDPVAEAYFLGYELDLLDPYIISLDARLKKPKAIHLRLLKLKEDPGSKTGRWIAELGYETDEGVASLYELWQGISRQEKFGFTSAGCFFLKDARFSWLSSINQKRWSEQGRFVRLTTLEWLKLMALEEVRLPQGDSKAAMQARALYDQLLRLEPTVELNLTGLKSALRSYQLIGVRWLWFLYHYGLSGLLCDEMGLGKTHQAMGLLAAIKNLHPEKRVQFIVVCPTSVIYHWEELCKRFFPDLKALVYHGPDRNLSQYTEGQYELLITSYGILRSDEELLGKLFFEVAVFDEIQIAKNAQSQTHRSLKKLSAQMRVGLSGTPIENRLLELKALFDLVIPGYLPYESLFKELFVHPIEKYHDEGKKLLLKKLIHPFLLRRKKTEVLTELPEKIEEISYCDLSDEQKELYKKTYQNYSPAILKELQDTHRPVPIGHIFALLSKLKQICDHPSLIYQDYANYYQHASGKWELFIELLNEIRESKQKLVVFSQYLGMLDIIESYLKEKQIGYAGIRGSTKDRKEQVQMFQQEPSCEVFVGSLQAAGVGIDLTAASFVIHYDRWWNPAKENQATDRVHRIGQNRGVQVFKLVSKHTVEEHVHRLIERKILLTEVIGFDEQDQLKGLKREDLLEFFRLMGPDA